MSENFIPLLQPALQLYLAALKKAFRPQTGFKAQYVFNIEEKKKSLMVTVDGQQLECSYGAPQPSSFIMRQTETARPASGEYGNLPSSS